MKRMLALALIAVMALSFVACNMGGSVDGINHYIPLEHEQTLNVGGQNVYVNNERETVTEEYLTYLVSATYSLRRTSLILDSNTPYVSYEGDYYYWVSDFVYDEELLGEKKVVTSNTYEYLPYGEAHSHISVRQTQKVETTYDYEGGFVTKPFEYTVQLSYDFNSFTDLEEKCPELARLIDTTGSKKYYVDVTTPTTVKYNTSSYTDTYFYLESNEAADD